MRFSVTIRGGFDYTVEAATPDEARQRALRLHVGLGRPPGWVERCSG